MSQENVEIVRRMHETYLAGDVNRALDYFHPDVAADFSVRGDTGPTTGREALDKTVTAWVSTWDDSEQIRRHSRCRRQRPALSRPNEGREREAASRSRIGRATEYTVENGLITSLTMYLPRTGRSPRSRRAVGVGHVAGERGDSKADFRSLELRRHSKVLPRGFTPTA